LQQASKQARSKKEPIIQSEKVSTPLQYAADCLVLCAANLMHMVVCTSST
jgi:hypothetical protein